MMVSLSDSCSSCNNNAGAGHHISSQFPHLIRRFSHFHALRNSGRTKIYIKYVKLLNDIKHIVIHYLGNVKQNNNHHRLIHDVVGKMSVDFQVRLLVLP